MILWNQVVDVLRESIFAYALASHGNVGVGIVAVTFLARLALLPLMLRVARVSAAHQAGLARVQPELDALKLRFKSDPVRLADETRRLFAREGLPFVPLAGVLGGLVQMPMLLALFSAVRQSAAAGGRFLWIRSIVAPDPWLAIVVAAITWGSASLSAPPPHQNKVITTVLPVAMTLLALSRMAAGVGLYWGVSSAVGLAQGVVLRGRRARQR